MKFSKANFNIIIAGIFSTLIAIGFGRFIYTPILPNMQNELYLNSTNMGMISSFNYFGYLIGSIIPIIWKYNNFRKMIIFSSIIWENKSRKTKHMIVDIIISSFFPCSFPLRIGNR